MADDLSTKVGQIVRDLSNDMVEKLEAELRRLAARGVPLSRLAVIGPTLRYEKASAAVRMTARVHLLDGPSPDSALCANEDPYEMCLRCDCWKATRARCM